MTTKNPTANNNLARVKLALIFFVALAPIALAFVMFKTGVFVPESRTNQGILINPLLPFSELPLKTLDGSPIDITADRTWSMVLIGDERYESVAKRQLSLMNQSHIALGKEQNRVKMLYLIPENVESEQNQALIRYSTKKHPLIQIVITTDSSFFDLTHELLTKNQEAEYSSLLFIVDPMGNAMLYFLPKHADKDILNDLKRLLKHSKMG